VLLAKAATTTALAVLHGGIISRVQTKHNDKALRLNDQHPDQ
jgi:hypothetical protein